MRLERDDGGATIDGGWYRLRLPAGNGVGFLDDAASGARWAELRLLASVDTLDGPDETLDVARPAIERNDAGSVRLVWSLASSRWAAKRLVLDADEDGISIHAEVEGHGRPTDVLLLGGRAVLPASGGGTLLSGRWFETVLCPSPTDPGRIARSGAESTVIGVVSGSEPGRGNWFFTPGPFCYAVSRSPVAEPTVVPPGPWLGFGLGVRPGEASFAGFGYRAMDRGFGFVLDYEAQTVVSGTWRTPSIRIVGGPTDGGSVGDPYAVIRAHARWLKGAGFAPAVQRADRPAWWREPIFCGWGEQCRRALLDGRGWAAARAEARQTVYDGMLEWLEARGVVPGTIVIDDKWQAAYGTNEPDPAKWPDLRTWIAGRHDRGQRVLLWWKAWDAEGLPAEWCVRSASGAVIGVDPTNPACRDAIHASIRRMLEPEGLGADGLKIDFTARTPSGLALTRHGEPWGVELLRLLLETVNDAARSVLPDALLIGHTPNPLIAPYVDMLRLNDTLRLDDPQPRIDVVSQMRYRAAVVRAACPDHLIDTDDWCAPDLATWRAYLAAKAELGVPALYYATGLDLSGEGFEDEDYASIRQIWAAYRRREGLPEEPRPR